jgi:SulP family sulfate permease
MAQSLTRFLPRRGDYAGLGQSWRRDVVAGLTVGVVALPLALAFGIASGVGARAGLATAVVAGIVAAVLGGSRVQVSGPTGAMTVVLVPVVAHYGVTAVAVVGIMAGIVVTAAGILRLGRYLVFMPWPVIEGFTVGIAAIIFLQQVPAALGVPKPHGENTAVVAWHALVAAPHAGNRTALGVVALVAVVMVALPKVRRSLPASLIGVAAATGAIVVTGAKATVVGALPSSLPAAALPAMHLDQLGRYVGPALAVAALAAIESLLSARVADGMADGHPHDPDRELFGQGIANIVSPLFGGMPATGAIARTAVNVRSGAQTRLAAIVHAVTLLLVVLFAGSLVAKIPLAALAGVLMVTAVRMVEPHSVKAILRSTRSDAIVLTLTAVATIAFDLIVAVEIGLAVAGLLALRQVARNATFDPAPLEIVDGTERDLLTDRILTYRIDGALFFGVAQRFLDDISRVTDIDVVILRLPQLQVLDATGAQALGALIDDLERRHITVLLKGPRPEHARILDAVGALDRLAHTNHMFATLDEAIAHARTHIHHQPRVA